MYFAWQKLRKMNAVKYVKLHSQSYIILQEDKSYSVTNFSDITTNAHSLYVFYLWQHQTSSVWDHQYDIHQVWIQSKFHLLPCAPGAGGIISCLLYWYIMQRIPQGVLTYRSRRLCSKISIPVSRYHLLVWSTIWSFRADDSLCRWSLVHVWLHRPSCSKDQILNVFVTCPTTIFLVCRKRRRLKQLCQCVHSYMMYMTQVTRKNLMSEQSYQQTNLTFAFGIGHTFNTSVRDFPIALAL